MISKVSAFAFAVSGTYGVRKLDKSGIKVETETVNVDYLLIAGGTPAGLEATFAQVPECNYTGDRNGDTSDLWKKIPDMCCDAATWTAAGVAAGSVIPLPATNVKDGVTYTCPVLSIGNGGYVRGHLDCTADHQVVWAESCHPSEGSWPMNETFAATQWEQGTHESCGCTAPDIIGNGCWVGQTFPGAAYYAKLTGDGCSPSTTSELVATGKQRWSLPKNAEMLYSFNPDRSTTAKLAPECDVPNWGDIDLASNDEAAYGYDYIGAKVPDSCCNQESWLEFSAPEPIFDDSGVQHTCFIRDAAFPGFRTTDKMRLYLGCENGQLVAAENCVPSSIDYMSEQDFVDNTYAYPMNASFAATQARNGTPDQCGCSRRSRFNNGPGCYLAYASAYDSGMKFKGGAAPASPPAGPAPDAGLRAAVFVSIKGEC